MGLSKLILETVKKYLKCLEKRCQGLVTVTYKKRKINCNIKMTFYFDNKNNGIKTCVEESGIFNYLD